MVKGNGAGDPDFDYVVVGSGAGGGTVASRLAEAGMRVLVLEAGGDPGELVGGYRLEPGVNRLPDDYDVPAFHAFASENEAMTWDFFVRHYADDALQRQDRKYLEISDGKPVDGVLYPRAGTLGGCTAHNAMILVRPYDAEWDFIAQQTGDPSWAAAKMHGYFRQLEDCRHRPAQRRLARLGLDCTGHGWDGWLVTERGFSPSGFSDQRLVDTIVKSAQIAFDESGRPVERLSRLLHGAADPNDQDLLRENAVGVRYTPLTTRDHRRMGSRERLLETAERFPSRLRVELDALATRVLFDGNKRAVGVEYLKGERLYRAHVKPSEHAGELREVRAAREVILAGGAFNTPQLLMLSGIGPPKALKDLNIEVLSALCGVGQNLQDRYEVSVVNRMGFAQWESLADARFAKDDLLYQQWARDDGGPYATNGAGLAVITRSAPERPLPDLFCMALLGRFSGYYPGYARDLADNLNCLSWAILKAQTNNRKGTVILASKDPRDPPKVNFHYFGEDTKRADQGAKEDLASVVAGIRFVRRLAEPLRDEGLIAEEELPGEELQSDEQLENFVRANAWGHHASCSCHIGPPEKGGVLTSDFRVHGVERLRVVDASVFPRIPGFFIASAVYMVAEKAADVILADARGTKDLREQEIMPYDIPQLLKMSQAQLDDLFTQNEPGPLPDGQADGTAIIAPGTQFSPQIAEFIKLFAWQGKEFDAKNGVLRNRILPFGINAIIAKVYKEPSWLDGKECIVLDYSDTSLVAHWIRDEIRLIGPDMYLGKVYWNRKQLINFVLQF